MIQFIKFFVCFIIICSLNACSPNENNYRIETDIDGRVTGIVIIRKYDNAFKNVRVEFDSMGVIKFIQNGGDEILYFYENGKLRSKITENRIGILNGPAHYFYSSGYLSGAYIFKKDKPVNFSVDFWDSIFVQKTITRYNGNTGEHIERFHFDKEGDKIIQVADE